MSTERAGLVIFPPAHPPHLPTHPPTHLPTSSKVTPGISTSNEAGSNGSKGSGWGSLLRCG